MTVSDGIGAEYNGAPVDDGLEVIELPEFTYAVFPFKGKMPEKFNEWIFRLGDTTEEEGTE